MLNNFLKTYILLRLIIFWIYINFEYIYTYIYILLLYYNDLEISKRKKMKCSSRPKRLPTIFFFFLASSLLPLCFYYMWGPFVRLFFSNRTRTTMKKKPGACSRSCCCLCRLERSGSQAATPPWRFFFSLPSSRFLLDFFNVIIGERPFLYAIRRRFNW